MNKRDTSGPTEIILHTEQLSRAVGEKMVVNGISADIRNGEIMAIVGPSGAGKSSFLRLLNRLDEPTSGTVHINGVDYREIPPRELRRRLGMVMQRPYLFPGNIEQNIRFGPSQRQEEFSRRQVEDLLNQVDLPGYADRSINNLSIGEAQRVSLARTLANSPEILLLDEPTSSLDPESEKQVESLICRIINENKMTCLIITHNMQQAERIADRVMLIKKGKLEKIGSAKEVLHAQ